MKTFILTVFTLLVSVKLFSQTIDYNNFDYSLYEKKVIEKINTYRNGLGLKILYSSNTLKNFTSVKTSTQNSSQDKGFHLKADETNDIKKIFGNVNVAEIQNLPDVELILPSIDLVCANVITLFLILSTELVNDALTKRVSAFNSLDNRFANVLLPLPGNPLNKNNSFITFIYNFLQSRDGQMRTYF